MNFLGVPIEIESRTKVLTKTGGQYLHWRKMHLHRKHEANRANICPNLSFVIPGDPTGVTKHKKILSSMHSTQQLIETNSILAVSREDKSIKLILSSP